MGHLAQGHIAREWGSGKKQLAHTECSQGDLNGGDFYRSVAGVREPAGDREPLGSGGTRDG